MEINTTLPLIPSDIPLDNRLMPTDIYTPHNKEKPLTPKEEKVESILTAHPVLLPMDKAVFDGSAKRACPCAFCESSAEMIHIQSDVRHKQIRTIVDGHPVLLDVLNRKLRCPRCGTVFNSVQEIDVGKTYTDGFRRYLTIVQAMDSSITSADLRTLYGISGPQLTALGKEQSDINLQNIVSVAPCPEIHFYPFMYGKEERCAVMGIDEDQNGLLLGILDSYDTATIGQFIEEKIQNPENVVKAYCAFDKAVANCLYARFPKATVRFSREIVNDALAACRLICPKDKRDALSLFIVKFTALLRCNRRDFETNVPKWVQTLPPDVRQILAEILVSLNTMKKEWGLSVPMERDNGIYQRLQQEIDFYRSHNFTFERMRDMVMFRNGVTGYGISSFEKMVLTPSAIRNYCVVLARSA